STLEMGKFGCCLRAPVEEITTLDYRHSGLEHVPAEVFNSERTLEELFLDSNSIRDLPRELFYCHGLQKLTVADNEVTVVPPAIASLINLRYLDISKNGIIDLPDQIKQCKLLRHVEANINPLGKLPEGFTQLLCMTHLYLNDCFLDYLPGNFGRLSKLKILELRENHLKTLPNSLSRLTELERLDIGNNEFTELPEVVGHLSSLLELWCDSNQITKLPKEIGKLKQLMFFDAMKNRIEKLPSEIEGCESLSDLHLSLNLITELPESIGRLDSLTTLKVDDNQLTSLPFSIGGLQSLSELNVSCNDIEEFPPSIGLIQHLRTLYADENFLVDIPPELGSCKGLTILSVRSNKLTFIPDEIGHIPKLRVLNLSDNAIQYLPFSLTKLKYLQALWLAENQSKPLIRLQTELNSETGQRKLTCYLLPQQPSQETEEIYSDGDADSFHPSMWEEERAAKQQIHFDFGDMSDVEGKLERKATPYPKEMKQIQRHLQNLAIRQSQPGATPSPERTNKPKEDERSTQNKEKQIRRQQSPVQKLDKMDGVPGRRHSGEGTGSLKRVIKDSIPEPTPQKPVTRPVVTKPVTSSTGVTSSGASTSRGRTPIRDDDDGGFLSNTKVRGTSPASTHRAPLPQSRSYNEISASRTPQTDHLTPSGKYPERRSANMAHFPNPAFNNMQSMGHRRYNKAQRTSGYSSDTGYQHRPVSGRDGYGSDWEGTRSAVSSYAPVRPPHGSGYSSDVDIKRGPGGHRDGYTSDLDGYNPRRYNMYRPPPTHQPRGQPHQQTHSHNGYTPTLQGHHAPHNTPNYGNNSYNTNTRTTIRNDEKYDPNTRTVNPSTVQPIPNHTPSSPKSDRYPTNRNSSGYGYESKRNPPSPKSDRYPIQTNHWNQSAAERNPPSPKSDRFAYRYKPNVVDSNMNHQNSPLKADTYTPNHKRSMENLQAYQFMPAVIPEEVERKTPSRNLFGESNNLNRSRSEQHIGEPTRSQLVDPNEPITMTPNRPHWKKELYTALESMQRTPLQNTSKSMGNLAHDTAGDDEEVFSPLPPYKSAPAYSPPRTRVNSQPPEPQAYPQTPTKPQNTPATGPGYQSPSKPSFQTPNKYQNASKSFQTPTKTFQTPDQELAGYMNLTAPGNVNTHQQPPSHTSESPTSHTSQASSQSRTYDLRIDPPATEPLNLTTRGPLHSNTDSMSDQSRGYETGDKSYETQSQGSANHPFDTVPPLHNPQMHRYDDVAAYKTEPNSQVSSSTDSGYGHIYERLQDFQRNGGTGGPLFNRGIMAPPNRVPPSPPTHGTMLPPPSRDPPSVPYSRESTPQKGDSGYDGDSVDIKLTSNTLQSQQSKLFTVNVSKNPGLGFSIAGGVGSVGNPFVHGDMGIFVTKVQPEGPAGLQLKAGDKIIEVNGHDFVDVQHEVAVSVLKNSGSGVTMVIQRD
ncbi:unnamed protein product, partial [Owenia fusiformis]